jgi:hypothetical protein
MPLVDMINTRPRILNACNTTTPSSTQLPNNLTAMDTVSLERESMDNTIREQRSQVVT